MMYHQWGLKDSLLQALNSRTSLKATALPQRGGSWIKRHGAVPAVNFLPQISHDIIVEISQRGKIPWEKIWDLWLYNVTIYT